jgi:hypothetical protein
MAQRSLAGPMAGYFARSTPADRGIPADQAENASGARRQRRCRVGTIDRVNDSGHVSSAATKSVPRTPASRPRTLERIAMSHVQSVTGTGRAAAGARAGGRHLGVALLVIATAQLMVVLDSTVVNVALPHIQRSLGFSGAGLEWVVNAYALAFGGLLLLGGRAGDLLGRRRMFVTGLLLFSAASLAGGFATSQAWLLAARAVQGAGGAIVARANDDPGSVTSTRHGGHPGHAARRGPAGSTPATGIVGPGEPGSLVGSVRA